MKRFVIALCAFAALFMFSLPKDVIAADNDTITTENQKVKKSRLTLGGYGEAVYTYNFYSDNMFRYTYPDRYRDAKGHGRVDLPHVVINLGYDFGRGWSMGSEIEFEHGGNEVAVEIEAEETGEFEHEIERGGEVALEQLWIQKSFNKALNIRLGHIIVPVGQTNNSHLPTQFFTNYRPEGEATILPCTWHETGISIWGKAGKWRYEVLVVPALNSNMFNNANWVKNGSASAYEFRVANNLAGAFRVDNYSVKNLHFGISGYIGNTFNNDIVTNTADKYKNIKGTLFIGTAEFDYKANGLVLRGNFVYGHLNDAATISTYNKNNNHQAFSPYPRTLVGENAVTAGGEVAYDIFKFIRHKGEQNLYVFGRYDYYDSYIPYEGALTDYQWTERHVVSAGLNYYPIKQVVIKAEFSERFLKSQYNNEPMFSLGVAYSGFFVK